jgi:hypothetical protein
LVFKSTGSKHCHPPNAFLFLKVAGASGIVLPVQLHTHADACANATPVILTNSVQLAVADSKQTLLDMLG